MAQQYQKRTAAAGQPEREEAEQRSSVLEYSNSWLVEVLGLGRVEREKGTTSLDLIYEQMAHRMAYQSGLHPEDKALLTAWGYEPSAERLDGKEGLQAVLFRPAEGSDKVPVVVFRGTEIKEIEDLKTDLDPVIGQTQYESNRRAIADLFRSAGGTCDVSGHSLGAALAQLAILDYSSQIRRAILFQAPGISKEQADRFSKMDEKPDIRYHMAKQDMVDLGGEAHLEGKFLIHNARNANNPVEAHVGYLLLSPQYADLRAELGLSDQMLNQLDIRNDDLFGVAHKVAKLTEQHETEERDSYYRPEAQSIVETIRRAIGSGVDTIQSWWD